MIWAYVLMCLIYGTTFLAIRAGDEAGMPPFLFAALRFAVAGIITLVVVYARNRSSLPRTWKIYRTLVSVGFFSTTSVFAIVYFVEQYVPSCYAALMAATMPILVLILGGIRRKRALTALQAIGLLLSIIGVLAVVWPGIREGMPHWIPYTLALLVAQVVASIGVLQSRSVLDRGVSPFVVNGFQALFGSVGLFILSACSKEFSLSYVHAWKSGILALTYLIEFGSIIASTLYFWLVKRITAVLASTWTYVSPVIAIAVGFSVYREPVYLLTIVGAVVILAGVFLLNLKEFKGAYHKHWYGTENVLDAGE